MQIIIIVAPIAIPIYRVLSYSLMFTGTHFKAHYVNLHNEATLHGDLVSLELTLDSTSIYYHLYSSGLLFFAAFT